MQGIYKIENKITKNIYIGSSKYIERRWKEHKTGLEKGTHHSYKLQSDYNLLSIDDFNFEIIEIVDNVNDLLNREQYYLDNLNPYYNILKFADCRDYFNKQSCDKDTVELKGSFVKVMTGNINNLLQILTNDKGKIDYKVISMMLYLMQFIGYRGLLQHENGKPVNSKFIVQNGIMNRTDVYRCLKTLKVKNIISIIIDDEKEYFLFNPVIANRGRNKVAKF